MKKILFFLFLLCLNFVAAAQFPLQQNIGNDSTLLRIGANSKGAIRGSLIPSTYTDTTQANLGRIDDYPFAIIGTSGDGNTWMRNYLATGWVRLSGGTSPSGNFWNVGGNLLPVYPTPYARMGTLTPYGGAISFITNSVDRLVIPDGGIVRSSAAINKYLMMDTSTKEMYYGDANGVGTVTSVGLTMPSAFSVANSPVTGAGTLAVTGAGTTSQYIRGDGSLSTFNTDARGAISLTTTGSSGAATYNSGTGVLNIPQYSGGGGSSGPVTYVAAPQAISDTFNVLTTNWVQSADVAWPNELIDNGFILFNETWANQSYTNNLIYGGSTSDTRTTGNGIFTQTGSASLDTTGIAWGYNVKAPYYGISVPIKKTFGTGTEKVMIAFANTADLTVSGRDMVAATWNADATAGSGQVTIYKRKSNVDSLLTTTTVALLPPFELGFTVTGQSLTVWAKKINEGWKAYSSFVLDTARDFDMRDTATLAAFDNAAVYFIRQSNASATMEIGGPYMGYTKGVGIANFSPVSFDDGTPVTKGNDYFVLGSVAQIPGALNDSLVIRTANANVFRINPQTGSVSTYQKVFTERQGNIYGENSGSVTYDSTRNKWIYLIPTWGTYGLTDSVSIVKYETDEFKNGVTVLRDGVYLDLDSTTNYDPDLKKIGSTWYLAYTKSFAAVGGIALATSTDLVTWVTQRTNSTAQEGTSIMKIGGKWRVAAASIGTNIQRFYDTTLTSVGTYSLPTGLSFGAPPHPDIIQVREGGKSNFYWLYFDGRLFSTTDYTNGDLKILKASQVQTGHDFAIKNYSDIGENFSPNINSKLTNDNLFTRVVNSAYFNISGGIGIGPTTPNTTNHKLHAQITGTSFRPFGVDLENTSTGAVGIAYSNSTTGTNEFFTMLTSEATPTFNIGWGGSGGSGYATNYLSVLSTSGNVGISTQTPQHPFQTYGAAKFGGAANQQYGAIAFGDDASTSLFNGMYRGTSAGALGGGNWINVGGYDGINFLTGNVAFGSQTKRMGIDVNGYITTSGRLQGFQGTDVASAAGAITLSNGNTFEVTGTAAITLISNTNWQNGSVIHLVFTSTATLTDGTANSGTDIGMELAGNANFTASADDVVTLVLSELGSVQRWREVSRSVN